MQMRGDGLVADGSTANQDFPAANDGTPAAGVVIVPNPEQSTVEALPAVALSKSPTAHDRPASESLIRASSEKETKPNRVSLSSQQYQPNNKSDIREQHHYHRRSRSNDDRPIGHWPPRPEESSPPIPVIDTQSQSALTESWNELSTQFEESVGKPSRDALHKFFYPPANSNSNHQHSSSGYHRRNSSPRHSSSNHRRLASVKKRDNTSRDREIIKVKQIANQTTDTEVNDAAPTQNVSENINSTPETTMSAQPMTDPPTSLIRHEVAPEAPSTTDDEDGKDESHSPESTQEQNNPKETAAKPPTNTQEQIASEPLQQQQQQSNTISQYPSGDWHQEPPQVPADFQQSFEDQEEQDRKYVERFWTTYDDIIMLSLFTQLGVVARLAASTWFTFFDGGVFRADSPLFTVLPLNCLSCFLLGLLGSGERLMEVITTRFTPRNLQQTIVREYQNNDDNPDGDVDANHDTNVAVYDNDDEDFENLEQGHLEPYRSGLRWRRKHRRPKRTKKNDTAYFKSWEPPIHWHDDLREVQLLALERRIRSSKCLILFPVNKEDADVMEHYVGEGYKASTQRENHQRQNNPLNPNKHSRRRRRRRFGRKKYCATSLADVDDSLYQQGTFIGSGSFDDDDDDDDDDDEFGDDDYHDDNGGNSDASDNDEDDAPIDDGRFRFDLKLTESTDKSRRNVTTNSADPHTIQAAENASATEASPASMPPSIQKLIKRSPRMPTQLAKPNRKSKNSHEDQTIAASPTSAQSDNPGALPISQQSESVATGITQPMQSAAASSTNVTCSQAQAKPEPSSPAALSSAQAGTVSPIFTGSSLAVQPTSRSSSISDPDQTSVGTASGGEGDPQLEQIISNVQANVSENISRIRRVNLADGWDVGTTPEAMSDDLMLGLRDGFCGALSSFSSWNSSMLGLLREGQIGEAFIGYLLGLQLPIVAYRFGQHVAVYYFVWRCRREARREERKGGYGIRVKMDDDDDDDSSGQARLSSLSAVESADECFEDEHSREKSAETSFRDDAISNETPSLRAICTALFLVALVTQFTSLSFYPNPQLALSLLFSPVGTLARWRLSRLNNWRPGFPVGTFTCNILACALSGSLGSLLAGNPGPKERVLLQSVIAGFGGTLSSLATFIVEILSGMDPLLFRFDGVIYAICSIAWALIIGFVFSASADWADETT